MTFWDSATWHEHERLCGDEPGTRSLLLAAADWQTRVVDTAQPIRLRKSSRSLVHRAHESHDFFVWNAMTSVPELWMREFQLLHLEDAGRVTRPDATWLLMVEWLRTGHGLLVGAKHREPEAWCAFAYFVVYGQWAYYHSSAKRELNVMHGVIVNALGALKSMGVRWVEMGWQGHDRTNGEVGRDLFKTGFGGYDIPAKEAPCLASSV